MRDRAVGVTLVMRSLQRLFVSNAQLAISNSPNKTLDLQSNHYCSKHRLVHEAFIHASMLLKIK